MTDFCILKVKNSHFHAVLRNFGIFRFLNFIPFSPFENFFSVIYHIFYEYLDLNI